MSKDRSFKRIDPATAAQVLARDKVLVLDSRDPDNYERAHIANARRLSSANLDAILVGTPTATPVLLYCYHGKPARPTCRVPVDHGFALSNPALVSARSKKSFSSASWPILA
ncbi:MAG: rhodanese-like domain-containing protein [Thiobacillus sp.]|jgi:thiosulfate/3-mercaptopyruvate sulfurtransferase